jgi:hypothetical protein
VIFDELVGHDITVHTDSKMFRGILQRLGDNDVLELQAGIDTIFVFRVDMIAITLHGAERGI